jgi:hypothetical protein
VTRWILATTLIAAALTATAVRTDAAADVVELRVRGRYLVAPATVRILVVVEPDAANRTLRVEMDGDLMFRASARRLEGAAEKRLHEIEFRDVPAGQYRVLAAVLSTRDVRGTAVERVDIIDSLRRESRHVRRAGDSIR